MKRSLVRRCAPVALALMTVGSVAFATDETETPAQPPAALACTNAGPESGAAPILASVVRQTDPTHKGHLHLTTQPGDVYPFPQCGIANVIPPVVEPDSDFHYAAFAFKNRSLADACVSAELRYYQCGRTEPCPPEITCQGDVASGICGGVGLHEAAVYLGAFDPADIRTNFLADSTRYTGGPGLDHIEFTVPSLATFTIVVRAPTLGTTVGTGLGYDPYFDLYVWGCGQQVVTAITPSTGPATGGTNVVIEGSGFKASEPVTVSIGSEAQGVVVLDDSTIRAVTSITAAGTYDVKVAGVANGQPVSSTLAGAFTYATVDMADAGDSSNEPPRDDPQAPEPGTVTIDPSQSSTEDGCQAARGGASTFALVFGTLAALSVLGRRRRAATIRPGRDA